MKNVFKYVFLRENCAQLLVFTLFAVSLFAKCALFNYSITGSIIVSSFYKNPLYFLFHYSSIIFISTFIASFVYITRRRLWVAIVSLSVDFMLIANLVYFRANGLLLNGHAIIMVDNMSGFWSSVTAYFKLTDWLYPLSTLVLTAVCYLFKNTSERRCVGWWSSALLISICFYLVKPFHTMKWGELSYISAVSLQYDFEGLRNFKSYIAYYNPVTYSLLSLCQAISLDFHKTVDYKEIMSSEDITYLDSLLADNKMVPPHCNLYIDSGSCENTSYGRLCILLVESLESWAVDSTIMPNLVRYMGELKEHLLYADRVLHQTQRGTSMDAQLIVNTGILPTEEDVVCNFYYGNKYYSIADAYHQVGKKSQMVVPHTYEIWNQDFMSRAFHFDSLATFDHYGNDEELFTRLSDFAADTSISYLHAITISSHAPFEHEKDKFTLDIPAAFSECTVMQKLYIQSLNYTDKWLGAFLDGLDKDVTLVIAGDHTWESNLGNIDCYIPLMVYSPSVNGYRYIHDVVYQMDIYPTVMDVISATDYKWKGFGVSLFDDCRLTARPVSVERVEEISERVIRSNYFTKFGR